MATMYILELEFGVAPFVKKWKVRFISVNNITFKEFVIIFWASKKIHNASKICENPKVKLRSRIEN